jgi:hypothetical protein
MKKGRARRAFHGLQADTHVLGKQRVSRDDGRSGQYARTAAAAVAI